MSANAAARRQGLRPGLTLAEARALYPGLVANEADPRAEASQLEAVLAWCRRYTPLVALDGVDGLMLDVSGVAHLFGGEQLLLRDLETRLKQQGLPARTALAGSPELAWALARFASRSDVANLLIPADVDEKALTRLASNLPLAALRLAPAAVQALAQAGLRRIGDILHRPRAPIAARYGSDLFAQLDAMLGRAKSAISPVFEAPAYLVERRFAEGIARREDVEGTILILAGELAQMLDRHGEGARQLEVTLFRVDGAVKRLEAGTSRPQANPSAMARLFRERIEAAGEDGLETGYGFDLIRLAALLVEPLAPSQTGLTDHAAPRVSVDEVADLVDRLGARLGLRRVVRLEPRASHIPEFAVMAVPAAGFAATGFGTTGRGHGNAALRLDLQPPPPDTSPVAGLVADDLPARPVRLFAEPERIEAIASVPDGPPLRFRWRRLMHEVVAIEGPERIAPEWWRGGADLTRDYFRVEDKDGRRFWLFREGLYGTEAANPRWFIHGVFG